MSELAGSGDPYAAPGVGDAAAGASCAIRLESGRVITPAGDAAVTNPISEPAFGTTTICLTPRTAAGPLDSLPAWRWEDLSGLSQEGGGVVGGALNGVAGLFFAIAGMVWRIMLFIVYLATENRWLVNAAYQINVTFVRLAQPAFILFALGWFITLADSARKMLIKATPTALVRAIAVFMIPAGLLFAMYSGAKTAKAAGAAQFAPCAQFEDMYARFGAGAQECRDAFTVKAGEAAADVPMNPVYLATRMQDIFGMVSGAFSNSLTAPAGGREQVETSTLATVGMDQQPNCAGYIYGMTRLYRTLSDQRVQDLVAGTRGKPIEFKYQYDASVVLTHASLAWVTGLYEPWSQAEFGDTQLRGVAACHLLDDTNDIPVLERQATMGAAYPELVQSVGRQSLRDVGILVAGHQSVYETTYQAKFSGAAGDDCNKDNNRFNIGGIVSSAGSSLISGAINAVTGWCIPTDPISMVTGVGSDIANGAKSAVSNALGGNQVKFSDTGSESEAERFERQLRVFNWAACRWDPQLKAWTADSRWVAVGITSVGVQDGMTDGQIRKQASGSAPATMSYYCTTRWVYGHGPGFPMKERDKGVPGEHVGPEEGINPQLGMIGIDDFGQPGVTQQTQLHGYVSGGAARSIDNYQGRTTGNRIVFGLAAIIGAVAYFLMIGGPALGLLVATFGLIVLLSILPLLLAFMATGSEKAKKAGRFVIGLLGSKALFSVLIMVVVELQLLTLAIFATIDQSGLPMAVTSAGFTRSVLVMCSPLIVLLMMNRLLRTLGLKKLNSLGGALGLMGAVAAKASGAGSMSDFVGRGDPHKKRPSWQDMKNKGKAAGEKANKAGKTLGKLGQAGRAFLPKRLRDLDTKKQIKGNAKEQGDLAIEAEAARRKNDPAKAAELEEKRKAAIEKGAGLTKQLDESRQKAKAIRRAVGSKAASLAVGYGGMVAAGAIGLPALPMLVAGGVAGVGFSGYQAGASMVAGVRARRAVAREVTQRVDAARLTVGASDEFGRKVVQHVVTDTVDIEVIKEIKRERKEAHDTAMAGVAPTESAAASAAFYDNGLAQLMAECHAKSNSGLTGARLEVTQVNGARIQYAQATGLAVQDVIVSSRGLPMPRPDMDMALVPDDLKNHAVFSLRNDKSMQRKAEQTEWDWADELSRCLFRNGKVYLDGHVIALYNQPQPKGEPT